MGNCTNVKHTEATTKYQAKSWDNRKVEINKFLISDLKSAKVHKLPKYIIYLVHIKESNYALII